jgi:hypothetical protein
MGQFAILEGNLSIVSTQVKSESITGKREMRLLSKWAVGFLGVATAIVATPVQATNNDEAAALCAKRGTDCAVNEKDVHGNTRYCVKNGPGNNWECVKCPPPPGNCTVELKINPKTGRKPLPANVLRGITKNLAGAGQRVPPTKTRTH